jgi:hypothetical protein
VVHPGHGVVGEHPVRSPRQLQVVGDVGGGLGELHALEVVAQNDALAQAREPGWGSRAPARTPQSYRTLVRVKPASWTGMRVTATFGSSHFASSAASVSEIAP